MTATSRRCIGPTVISRASPRMRCCPPIGASWPTSIKRQAALLVNESLQPETAVRVAQSVVRIIAGNAGLMTGPGTNTYLIGEKERAVIDPGPDDDRHLEAILAHAGGAIRWIL